jgi:hypothetical protein
VPAARRLVGCIVGSAMLALPGAAAAQERFEITSGPVRAGEPMTLAFELGAADRFPTADRFGVDLPDGTAWNGNRFPRCRPGKAFRHPVRPDPEKTCPARSLVGSGTATVTHTVTSPPLTEKVRLVAVNAGGALHLVWKGTFLDEGGRTEKRTLFLRGRPQRSGDVTAWLHPFGFGAVGFSPIRLDSVRLKVGRTIRGRGLIEAGRCRRGRWTATGSVSYWTLDSEGLPESAGTGSKRDSVPCM